MTITEEHQLKTMLMTQLALYEKRFGRQDMSVFSFFRRDYIYRKNTWTRIFVFMGAVIMLGLYWFHRIFVLGMEINYMDFEDIQQYVIEALLFLAAVLAVYTLIGTVQGAHQYHKVHQRTDHYLATLRMLENLDCNDILDPALLTAPVSPSEEAEEEEEYEQATGATTKGYGGILVYSQTKDFAFKGRQ